MELPPDRPAEGHERLILWSISLLFFVLILMGLFWSEEGSLLLRATPLFLVIAWVFLLPWHELGHVLAARLVGWNIKKIVIGIGNPIFQRQIGTCHLSFHTIPISGYVIPSSTNLKHAPLKSTIVFAGGPLIEALLLIPLYLLGVRPALTESLPLLMGQCLAIAIFIDLLFNLFPMTTEDGSQTDGLGIIRSLLSTEKDFQHWLEKPSEK